MLCKVSKREKVDERERKKEKTLSLSFFLPESLSTSPLISPTPSPKAASSKTLCICPLPKTPRSPPLRAEEQCDSAAASEAKAAASPEGAPAAERSTCSRNAETAALASPSDRVTTGSFQDEGRREPACLTRRWEARTEEGPDALAAAAAALSALAAAAAAARPPQGPGRPHPRRVQCPAVQRRGQPAPRDAAAAVGAPVPVAPLLLLLLLVEAVVVLVAADVAAQPRGRGPAAVDEGAAVDKGVGVLSRRGGGERERGAEEERKRGVRKRFCLLSSASWL